MHEFRCATYSIECPSVSREKAANILLAHAGRGGDRGITEAAAEIARAAARSWLAPLLDSACDRLAFIVGNLFDLAAVRNQQCNSDNGSKLTDMDGYVGYHAALRRTYSCLIKDLAKQCKQLVRHHLDSVTSPYSLVCYENDLLGSFGPSTNSMYMYNHASAGSFGLELSDRAVVLHNDTMKDQENIPPENNTQETMPGEVTEGREARCESLMTVPETPSPDQPTDVNFAIEKELGHCHEIAGRKRYSKTMGINRNIDQPRGLGNENNVSRSGSAYSEICSLAAQHFARMREVLVERSVTSTLNSGFLTPCQEQLVVAVGLDLFAVNNGRFVDMFVAPGAIDILQEEKQSLQKRQKMLHFDENSSSVLRNISTACGFGALR